jgi:hypothetical protein
LIERLAMRSTIARRLELQLASFEKRHGRIRRIKVPGQGFIEYIKRDPPRVKKINLWDVLDLFEGDIGVAVGGIRVRDGLGEVYSRAS